MDWKTFYKNVHPHFSSKRIEVGIRDWEQRSSTIEQWIKKHKDDHYVKILDCGCGVGTSGLILKEKGFENIFGFDISNEDLKHAKKNYMVAKMDCHNIATSENNFDIVIAMNLVEHIKNPGRFIEEAKRILKKDGIIMLSAPNTILVRKIIGRAPIQPDHINSWNYDSFKKFLKIKNLKILDAKPIGRVPLLSQCETFMILAKPVDSNE